MLTGRAYGGRRETSSPPMRMRPDVGSVKPPIIRRQVVLPDPEGPSSVKNSPASMARLMPSTARTAAAPCPKTHETLSSVTAAVMA